MLNENDIAILKRARMMLEMHYCDYICHALRDAAFLSGNCDSKDRLISYIEHSLSPWATLESWLSEKYKIDIENKDEKYKTKLRQTRLNWIDWLLEGK